MARDGGKGVRKRVARAAEQVDTPRLAAAAAATVAAAAGAAAGRIGLERVRRTPTSRAYRLKSGEPVGEGLLRVASGQLDHAVDELRGESDSDAAEAVHEARKDIKKLRALLRLTREPLGSETYRDESRELRDIGRVLGAVRDADVARQTLEKLAADCPDLLTPAAAGRLRRTLEAQHGATEHGEREQASELAAERLEAVRDRVENWPLEGDGWELLSDGMRRSYRAGRRRLRDARREPSTEALHEWRKRVKDHWYQLRLVRVAWPPLLEAAADEAHRVSEQLGDDHDLGALVSRLTADPAGPASERDRDQLGAATARRREQLRAAAFAGGTRLYAERSAAFERRIARYW